MSAAGDLDLTGRILYYEDFEVDLTLEHSRGRTVGEFDNALLTLMVMNTAEAHFNEDAAMRTHFGQRVVFGGISLAIVVGLAMQDTGGSGPREMSLDKARFLSPVFHGDTLYARTRVLAKTPEDDAGGLIRFQHWGINQRGERVVEFERTVRMPSRPLGKSDE